MLINKDEYTIRTLAFYQEKGGVYNDIISVLQRMRRDRRLTASIQSYLNDACFVYDANFYQPDVYIVEKDNEPIPSLNGVSCLVITCLYAAFQPQSAVFPVLLKTNREKHKEYYKYFKSVIDKYKNIHITSGQQGKIETSNNLEELEMLQDKYRKLRDDLDVMKSQNLAFSQQIMEQDKTISALRQKDSSRFDKALTLRYVLDYVKSRRLYNLSDQIIGMLKDMSRLATDEEYDEIKNVEQQMLDASMPKVENHNNISNSQVFSGLVNNSSFPIGVSPEDIVNKMLEQYTRCQNNGKQE